MIISQTPLRISFFGGGTDLREFYGREPGWVLSSAIDKYIFVVIKERFDDKIRVGYTRTEMVDHVDELEHELVRECLRRTGITKRVEISTMADIPSEGSGLGLFQHGNGWAAQRHVYVPGYAQGPGLAGARGL